MILLSDSEIRSIKAKELIIYREEDITTYPPDRAIAKAQLKKVFIWGDEPCPHSYLSPDTSKASRHECPICWQELLKEVEDYII